MKRNSEMDAALKEALQDALPETHPGQVPTVERIEREESLWLQILNMRSMTIIEYFVEEQIVLPSRLSSILALKKIQATNKLDEIYAICHEQLGEHDRAKELRDFMAKQDARVPGPDLLEDDTPDWLKPENIPQPTPDEWDRASNHNDPFFQDHQPSMERWAQANDQYFSEYGDELMDVHTPSHLAGEVWRRGEGKLGGVCRMRYALIRTKGRKSVRIYYLDALDNLLEDEDFLAAAYGARKRGWRRAILQRDDYMGDTIEMVNFAQFYIQAKMFSTGRFGISIKRLESYQFS